MRNWLHTFQARIMEIFLVLLLAVVAVLLLLYNLSMSSLYTTVTASIENSMQQTNTDVDRILGNAIIQADRVARDGSIQLSLRKELPDTTQELYQERVNFNYTLHYINQFSSDINGIYVIGGNGALYRSSAYGLHYGEYRNYDWYKTVMASKKMQWFATHKGSFVIDNVGLPTISLVMPINDRASSRVLGVVVVEILTTAFEQSEEGRLVFSGNRYLIGDDNQVIYTGADNSYALQDSDINTALKAAGADDLTKVNTLNIGGKEYLVSIDRLANSGWKTMGLLPQTAVYDRLENFRNIIIITIIIIAVVMGITAIFASRRISRPVHEMRGTMKQVEKGDFSVRVRDSGNDEIGELGQSLNHMIVRVDDLMQKEKDHQEQLRQAEFKALQSQINPHFLYNTLDSINWMARMNQVDKVSEMIDALTNFLRIGLSRGRTYIPLSEELKHVESYISIQKIRYTKLLNYEIDVPEELLDIKVIKMILQPIVENSLYHGIKEKGEPGLIRISAHRQEEKLVLCVSDNGMGMTQENLAKVENMMEKGIDFDPNAYGIINVQRRIRFYFGEGYGLHFESVYGEGTQVYVTIPVNRREQNV